MQPSDYKSFYTKESKIYHDTRYGGIYGRIFKALHHEALSECLDKERLKCSMLEVACGTGHTSELLIDKGFQPISCDLTAAMLNKAKSRFTAGKEQPTFIEANALNLPFKDEHFDLIVSTRFLHLFDYSTQKQVLLEMYRVLKPGGRIVVDFDNWSSRWIMGLPYLFYNLIKHKRLAPFSIYNRINETLESIKSIGFDIDKVYGVGGTHLVLFGVLSNSLAIKIGRLHQNLPLRIMAEQFLVTAVKK